MPKRNTAALVQNMGGDTQEPIRQGEGLNGFGKGGASTPPPVPVNEDVYVSNDKPYTLRLDIATMNELEAWCKARKLGKGPVIVAALREYMARHGEVHTDGT